MLHFAWQNLASRPARSVLALLGLTVAITGMVGLFSIAVGLQRTVGKTFERIPGLAAMQPGAPIPLFSRMPAAWADEIKDVPGVSIVRPELWARAQLVDGKMTFNPPRFLFGTDIASTLKMRSAVYRDDIKAGRFLDENDVGTMRCVISEAIAGDSKKGPGDLLKVDGNPLEIVGVYKTGSILLDVAIVMDQSTVRQLYRMDPAIISSVYIEPEENVNPDQLSLAIRDKFRGRSLGKWQPSAETIAGLAGRTEPTLADKFVAGLSGLTEAAKPRKTDDVPNSASQEVVQAAGERQVAAPVRATSTPADDSQEEGLEVRSARDWGNKIQEFSSDLDIFMYLMSGIGVVIALLSILNTMLMSVTERMTEFGILKANGWSSWDLLRLIGYESAALGLIGGALGCTFGWIGTLIVNATIPDKLNLYASPGLLFFSLIFSMGLGVLGGLYPALWATRLTPMEAIRRA